MAAQATAKARSLLISRTSRTSTRFLRSASPERRCGRLDFLPSVFKHVAHPHGLLLGQFPVSSVRCSRVRQVTSSLRNRCKARARRSDSGTRDEPGSPSGSVSARSTAINWAFTVGNDDMAKPEPSPSIARASAFSYCSVETNPTPPGHCAAARDSKTAAPDLWPARRLERRGSLVAANTPIVDLAIAFQDSDPLGLSQTNRLHPGTSDGFGEIAELEGQDTPRRPTAARPSDGLSERASVDEVRVGEMRVPVEIVIDGMINTAVVLAAKAHIEGRDAQWSMKTPCNRILSRARRSANPDAYGFSRFAIRWRHA